jgi:peroxiredoxin
VEGLKKSFIAIVAIFALVIWGVYDHSSKKQEAADAEAGINIGNKAPDFELQTLDGSKVKLSDFRGEKVMLNFWATWCPPCQFEMPHMEKFYEGYKSKDVVVLAVNLTQTEKSPQDVPKFVQSKALSFPVVLDEKGDVSGNYQVMAYPTSFMIDTHGIIREKFQGAIDYDTMKNSIAKMR